MAKAGLPSVLEPVGLCSDSARRPDGLTLPHWSVGKSLVWDATVACTVASSYVRHSAHEMGWVAEHADSEKILKYQELQTRFHVVPVAFETLGPVSQGTARFIKELSKRMTAITGDTRESVFLRQQLSLAVQRGHVASIIGAISCYLVYYCDSCIIVARILTQILPTLLYRSV